MSVREQLIEFIRTISRLDSDLSAVTDEDNLVESGIVDSLAVVQMIVYLETEHQLDVSAIDPTELVSIGGILNAIEK